MELDIMWKSRIENKVLLRQMGAGLVDTKRVLINNGKISLKWNHPGKSVKRHDKIRP